MVTRTKVSGVSKTEVPWLVERGDSRIQGIVSALVDSPQGKRVEDLQPKLLSTDRRSSMRTNGNTTCCTWRGLRNVVVRGPGRGTGN